MVSLPATCLVEGEAEASLALFDTGLSFWGGYDAATGRVIDRSHPACGEILAGRILAMPSGRGSSSASSVLAEALRRGAAPAAIIMTEADPIIAVGVLVARKLYGRTCPIVICDAATFMRLSDGAVVRVIARKGASSILMAMAVIP